MATLITVSLPMRTGLTQDVVTNSFVIGGLSAESPGGDALAVANEVTDLYNQAHAAMPAGNAMSGLLSPVLDRTAGACTTRLYDISGDRLENVVPAGGGRPRPPAHGSPFLEVGFQLGDTVVANSLPEEVAICVTLEAAGRGLQLVERADGIDAGGEVDRPRQRFTGRDYFGPWAQHSGNVHTNDAAGACRPVTALLAGLRGVVGRFAEQVNTIDPLFFLGVWSRSDGAVRSIDSARTDDAFDTQRRRGVRPTVIARTAVAVGANVELAA